MDLLQLSSQVANLCREVGQFIRQEAANFDRAKVEVKGVHNLVSYVDQEAEKQLVAGLRALLPEAGFVTEEGTAEASETAEYRWVIDPLDGTTNFVHGLPCFAVSVALVRGPEPVAGVVYEVSRDELFRAAQGHGAFLNDRPLRVSAAPDLDHALLATGFPYTEFNQMTPYLRILEAFMRCTQGVRRWGSAATDLAYVAAGRFEGFFEFNLNPWDVAAGVLLVREAGGRVTQFLAEGDPVFGREVVASNGRVHAEMQAVIGQFWA